MAGRHPQNSAVVQVVSLGYRTDLAILRLGGSRVEDRGDHLTVTTAHLPTYWWGNFVLLATVPAEDECERWLEHFATTFPGATHVAMGFDGTTGTVAELGWFAARGFSTEALAVMTAATVPAPAHLNREAVVRALRTDDDWAASVALRGRCTTEQRAAHASRDFDAARALTNRRITQAGHGEWFGAFVEGRLVSQLGLLAAGDGVARFQSVETDPAFRRRELAATLIHHAGGYGLTELGAHTLVIVADPTYTAMNLYRTLGFEPAEAQLIMERAPAGSR